MDMLPALREALDAGDEPLSSPEKLRRLFEAIQTIPPSDWRMAMALAALGKLLPMVTLPEDPAELDELLDRAGDFLAALKSDPVPA